MSDTMELSVSWGLVITGGVIMKNRPYRKMTRNLQFVMSQHHSIQFEFKRGTHTEMKKQEDKVRSEGTPAYSEEI